MVRRSAPASSMWVRQGDFAVDAALALTDMNDHAFAVEVGWFQMAQFIRAQAGGVEGGEHRPVFEIVGVVENANDFFHRRRLSSNGAIVNWLQKAVPGGSVLVCRDHVIWQFHRQHGW